MTITTTPDDIALKAKHAQDVGAGRLPRGRLGDHRRPRRGPRRHRRHQSRRARSRRRRRLGQRRRSPRPAAAPGSPPPTSRPSFSRSAGGPPRPRASTSTGRRPTPRRCRTTTASFDAVLSCVGVMFAPHHQEAADELVRVLRPGGTIGLFSWTPEGFIGQLFATMKPYAPPPPPGAQPPPLWGRADHVRALLGDRVDGPRGPPADAAGRPSSPTARRSATTSRPTTARRSRSTAPSPTTPSGSRPSTPSWPPWATGSTWRRRRWSGSTCSSPPVARSRVVCPDRCPTALSGTRPSGRRPGTADWPHGQHRRPRRRHRRELRLVDDGRRRPHPAHADLGQHRVRFPRR